MKFTAHIDVMPHKELLDPQGKTVQKNLHNVHIDGVESVRIGKHIEMLLEADDTTQAKAKVEEACKKFLANVIMESYTFRVSPAEES